VQVGVVPCPIQSIPRGTPAISRQLSLLSIATFQTMLTIRTVFTVTLSGCRSLLFGAGRLGGCKRGPPNSPRPAQSNVPNMLFGMRALLLFYPFACRFLAVRIKGRCHSVQVGWAAANAGLPTAPPLPNPNLPNMPFGMPAMSIPAAMPPVPFPQMVSCSRRVSHLVTFFAVFLSLISLLVALRLGRLRNWSRIIVLIP
jgi:hypothetical protein